MISFVEPYLSPLQANADICQTFQKRKRILSEDQVDALEFLFELNTEQRHVTMRMPSASGKTKVILFYYEWLKKQGEKVFVICYNKKAKYHLYASMLEIAGYDKFNFIGKKLTAKSATVFIVDQSSFCKGTLRNNQDRVAMLLASGDNVRVVEVQSDWNNLYSENLFARKSILSNRCPIKMKPYSLTEGHYFGSVETTVNEIYDKLSNKWFTEDKGHLLIITTKSELDKQLVEKCTLQNHTYGFYNAEDIIYQVERATRLVIILDIPSNVSSMGVYSIASKLRYIFYRFSNAFRKGRTVSAAVIVPSETSSEMGICMSLLLSSEQINNVEKSGRICNTRKDYKGFRSLCDLNLPHIVYSLYNQRIDGDWTEESIKLNEFSYFSIEEGKITVEQGNAPFVYTPLSIFCDEEILWSDSNQVLFM